MATESKMRTLPLCYRCEYRARFHETGASALSGCRGSGATYVCHMYRPVEPLVLQRAGNRGSIGAPSGMAARAFGRKTKSGDLALNKIDTPDGVLLLWTQTK